MIMFFDIDGTLVEDRTHRVYESTVTALRLAREAGNLLYVCTGRTDMIIKDDVRRLGFDGYVMGCGTNIVADDKELLYRTVDKQTAGYIVQLVRDCSCSPMYERRDNVFFDRHTREHPMVEGIRSGFMVVNGARLDCTTDDPDFGFDKFVICYDEQSDLDRFKRGIEGRFDFIDRGYGFAEMVPCGFSKGTGIDLVLAHYGIDKSQAYAVGDSLNDLPMKDHVGTFICMGNGEKLKPYADHITDDISADGIYNAMEKFGFFK